jgi:hypothetical protein
MIAIHPTGKRLRPPLHDWNEVLGSQMSSHHCLAVQRFSAATADTPVSKTGDLSG